MRQFIFLAIMTTAASASALTLEATKGKTSFAAIARPAGIRINGVGPGPSGDIAIAKAGSEYVLNGKALVDLSAFDTGITKRDEHMRNALEVEKFKQATLTFKDFKLPSLQGGVIKGSAQLELHGQQKPVDVEMTLTSGDGRLRTTSRFALKLSDFGITAPHFAIMTVADEVQISAEAETAASVVSESL